MSAKTDWKIPVERWTPETGNPRVEAFLARPAFDPVAEETARKVLADIRARGDEAVAEYVRKFDGAALSPERFLVSPEERKAAIDQVDADFKKCALDAQRRIMKFAQAGLRQDWSIPTPRGGVLGEQFVPLTRVGCYIPAGAAPLASTALMTVVLARAADVKEIVACTPARRDATWDPFLLFALDLAGATEIYKIGGIQAVGAMAYGTATIRKVQKIAGPGGPYVTAAKRLVYGDVDLDMVAGPSEIAVLADEKARPGFVAADLLSQAEHGTGHEKALLITPSSRLAESVQTQLAAQVEKLSRKEAVKKVLATGTLIVVVENLDIGMELCNRFAPEHLELLVEEPRRWAKKVRAAGAVFLGAWTPESAGDFAAGPSHVLPTGGTAAIFSGLTADSFRRRISTISLTRADLQEALPIIEAFGRVEQLDAHARSARIRFEAL
jgi:histidinol dehydrogenase